MPPGKLLLNVAFGFQGLEGFDHLQVGDVLQLHVLGGVVVFFGHQHTLSKEVLEDSDTVLFGHQHPAKGAYQHWVKVRNFPSVFWRKIYKKLSK